MFIFGNVHIWHITKESGKKIFLLKIMFQLNDIFLHKLNVHKYFYVESIESEMTK